MSSCILTFKRKIFLVFCLVCFGFILLDIALYIQAKLTTTKNSYINGNKSSKSKFFKLNEFYDKDIIFIGSSRTYYHVSTNIFKEHNIDIFNFGIGGILLGDYPDVIETIKKYNPKNVVISLSINTLYENLEKVKEPTLVDLKHCFNTDKSLFFNALLSYVENFHAFFTYSDAIFYRIIGFYNRFNIGYQTKIASDVNGYEKNINNKIDCEVFDIQESSNGRLGIKCRNGDGILIRNDISNEFKTETIELKNINRNTLNYIRSGILNPLLERQIRPIIILEPIFMSSYKYDIKEITQEFNNIKIIDLTNLYISKEKWADNGHLNNIGREEYTKHLVELYQKSLPR